MGGIGQLGERDAAQRCQLSGDARQLPRLVARRLTRAALLDIAVQPGRRDVGRVGLDHDGAQRQGLREAADLQRALEGQRAAEAELEAQRHKGQRLLLAAVERVRDAAAHADEAQVLQQRVGRATHMQDHRQIELARQLQLRDIEDFLPRPVEARHKMIQPDLAHRHQARVVAVGLQRSAQRGEIGVLRPVDVQRMNPQRVGEVVRVRQFANGVEVRRFHRRQHDLLHAGRAGTRHHGGAVRGELGGVEVAMGVGPDHGGIMPRGCHSACHAGGAAPWYGSAEGSRR